MNLASAGRRDLQGLKVLVVDDEEDARDIVAALLRHEGAEVETAESAAEGFARFTHFQPHVLVSDIGMPVEDGFAFIARLRRLAPVEGGRTPAIAVTAYTSPEDRKRALAAGFNLHLGKPVDLEHLISQIVKLAESSATPAPG